MIPRRPRFRPEVAPICSHCDRLGPCGYSLHVGGVCVRLVADHVDRAELVAGVTMRPVELVVDGEPRWLWTRSDLSAMDVDDVVTLFGPSPRFRDDRVVDGGVGKRPEPVTLFKPDAPPAPRPVAVAPKPRSVTVTLPAGPRPPRVAPSLGPTW